MEGVVVGGIGRWLRPLSQRQGAATVVIHPFQPPPVTMMAELVPSEALARRDRLLEIRRRVAEWFCSLIKHSDGSVASILAQGEDDDLGRRRPA